MFYRMPLRDAATLSALMNAKGLIELVFPNQGLEHEIIDTTSFAIMLFATVFTIGITIPLVTIIYKPSRKLVTYRGRAIDKAKSETELRILVVVQSSRNVPTIINLLEASNPITGLPLCVYVLHMAELTGRASAMLIAHNTLMCVISAVTYQIIPADSLYAEIPLAAVRSINQHKGVGRLMYMELKRRLQSVGVRTIYCWGDEESERFWFKQGFVPVGEVNTKGRARRLPVRADVRRALCFPGGSTLMISHLIIDSANSTEPLNHSFPPKLLTWSSPLAICQVQELGGTPKVQYPSNNLISKTSGSVHLEPKTLIPDTGCSEIVPLEDSNCANIATTLELKQTEVDADGKNCSCSAPGSGAKKRRVWDASHTSLNTKKVKGGHLSSCELDSRDCIMDESSLATSRNKSFLDVANEGPLSHTCSDGNEDDNDITNIALHHSKDESLSRQKCYKIMLMNIAVNAKQSRLTKIIKELGGDVTVDGSLGTHVITGRVRRTLNFCTALCSGAWVISACWLKESYRQGRFVDEGPFLLKDDEYKLKYRIELETAVFRAIANPQALFQGYDICVADHVQPPASTLSKIATCAGGKVIHGIDKVNEASKTIYVASEVEMKEALVAVNKGIWTFSSEWFMNCVMKQELDFDAPQFAESL